MRKCFTKVLAGILAISSTFSLVACGGGENPYTDPTGGGTTSERPEKVVDPTKTQLYVMTYDAGFGDEWLYQLEDRFEKAYADVEYEDGKKGVQVFHDGDMKNYTAQQISSNKYDVYFMEGNDYYALYAAGGVLEELTNIVTMPDNKNDGGKTLASKMTKEQRDFYGITATDGDPKYYAIPHYEGGWGLTYNVDLFDKEGYYIAQGGNGLIDSSNPTKSAGPDGQTGTTDDGLPATYDEFFLLCDEIAARGDIPLSWSGQYAEHYLSEFAMTLAANYAGVEQMNLNLTFNGLAKDLVVLDDNGDVVYENNQIKLEDKQISISNGYDISRQVAKYYALEFIQKIMTTDGYFGDDAFTSTHTHIHAQQDFLKRGTKMSTDKRSMAMLIDGPWWQGEATETFDLMSANDAQFSKQNRRFGWMPLPKATAAKVGEKDVYVDTMSAFTVVKSGLGPKKQAALDFVRFSATDTSLVEFTQITGALKSYNYTLDENQQKDLSYFTKSLIEYKNNSDLFVLDSGNAFFQRNRDGFQPTKIFTGVDHEGTTVSNPVVAFTRSKDYSGEDFFESTVAKWKLSTIWNG